MNHAPGIEGIPESGPTLRTVPLDDLILLRYPELWKRLSAQLRRRHMRLPSPFAGSDAEDRSLVIFQHDVGGERLWFWADPLAPARIPRTGTGFVMANEGCSHERATEIVAALAGQLLNMERSVVAVAPPIAVDAEARRASEIEFTLERACAAQRDQVVVILADALEELAEYANTKR